LKPYYDKYVLSVHALIIFTIFCFLQTITEKEILRRVSGSIFKLVSNFKEANKKLIISLGSEKLLKDLENHQHIHRKY
jgi:hypothetical protein